MKKLLMFFSIVAILCFTSCGMLSSDTYYRIGYDIGSSLSEDISTDSTQEDKISEETFAEVININTEEE